VRKIDSEWIRGSANEADLVQEPKYWTQAIKAICSMSRYCSGATHLAIGDNWAATPWFYQWTSRILRSELLKCNANHLQILHICLVTKPSVEIFADALVQVLPFASNLQELTLYDVLFTEQAVSAIVSSPLPSLKRLLIYWGRCVRHRDSCDAPARFLKAILLAPWAQQLTHLSFGLINTPESLIPIIKSNVLPRLTYLNLPGNCDPQSWTLEDLSAAEASSIDTTGYKLSALSFGAVAALEKRERKYEIHDSVFIPELPPFYRLPYQEVSPLFFEHSKWLEQVESLLSARQRARTLAAVRYSKNLRDALAPRGRMLLFLPSWIISDEFVGDIARNPSLASRLGVDFLATDRCGRNILHLHRYSRDNKLLILENLPANVASQLLMARAHDGSCPLERICLRSDEFNKILHLIRYKLPEDTERIKRALLNTMLSKYRVVIDLNVPWLKSLDVLLDDKILQHFFSTIHWRHVSPVVPLIKFLRAEVCGNDPAVLERVARVLIRYSAAIIDRRDFFGVAYPGLEAFYALRNCFSEEVPNLDSIIKDALTSDRNSKMLEFCRKKEAGV
jgi:hypothetical protein